VRVFLDTNILVSAVATRGLCTDVLQSVLAEHQLVTGPTVIRELRRVLKAKLRLPIGDIEEVEGFLRRHATVVEKAPPYGGVLRDPDDRRVLGEAIAGRADILVTGDKDLLEVAATLPLPVLSPRAFWEVLRSIS